MATAHEKEELMQTLKFTPRTYKVELVGRGGEIVMGAVDRKVYDYFEDNGIDIEEFAGDWDNDLNVPEEFQPFVPGDWYECDNIAHETGVDITSGTIIVHDELGNIVWESDLHPDSLDQHSVRIGCSEEVYPNDRLKPGECFYIGQSVEKGLFFGGAIRLTAPFDPKLLELSYGDYDGWELCSSVAYAGEFIDSDDYDTSGKGMYHTLAKVEGEEDKEWNPAAELDKIAVPIQDSDGEPLGDPKGKWPF